MMRGRKGVKKRVRTILIGIIIIVFVYLQWGRDVQVYNSHIGENKNYCSEDITIIANKIWIIDKEKFAHDMVQKSIDNSFKEVKFSYDLRQPNELCITVYTNTLRYWLSESDFIVCFTQAENGEYNILDNPEKFIMSIE